MASQSVHKDGTEEGIFVNGWTWEDGRYAAVRGVV